MKSKLYFGILISLIIFSGRFLDGSVTPNQQIVVEFSDSQISENESQYTIEAIKYKLQSMGIQHIWVGQDEEGKLKITYYSKTTIEQIQDILSENEKLQFVVNSKVGTTDDFPNQKSLKDYKLNISEIQKSSHSTNWDFEGVVVVELNHKSDRFNNLNPSASGNRICSEFNTIRIKNSKERNSYSLSFIDHHSYKIPEVRAGPYA